MGPVRHKISQNSRKGVEDSVLPTSQISNNKKIIFPNTMFNLNIQSRCLRKNKDNTYGTTKPGCTIPRKLNYSYR